MNDTPSDDAKSAEARVTKAGETIGERVQSATAATAAAAGQAAKVLGDAAKRYGKLGRRRADWLRAPLTRVVVRPIPLRGRSARTH